MTLVETINFWLSAPLGSDPAVRWRNLASDLVKFPETKDAAEQALEFDPDALTGCADDQAWAGVSTDELRQALGSSITPVPKANDA